MGMDIEASAARVMMRCDTLALHSEEPDRLTRRFATPPMHAVNDLVAAWMREAGMQVWQDAICNVIGRYDGESPGGKTLLLGSHLDTVRDAGKYDGPLGVLVALECVARLRERAARLPYAIEVYGFADEEGLRYHTAYLGSRAAAGVFPTDLFKLNDGDGVTLAEAIRQFGGDPLALATCARRPNDLLGYCEVHIEQGPVLERENLPLGIVTAIQGQTRMEVTFTGEAGHAGTVPMSLRHDALCAASEFILAVEALAQSEDALVATAGQIVASPGASNVIPGRVMLSLDLRHPGDTPRESACARLKRQATDIAMRRGVALDWRELQSTPAVSCDPDLAGLLARSLDGQGLPIVRLASGAGHDAAIMARLASMAMLFVRCAGGISHNPAESVAVEDVAASISVLERFLNLLAEEEQP
ncbi:MAG: allantoate amidohydrolase [Ktedonobacterales bacterium]